MKFLEAWDLYEQDKKLEGFREATLKSYHLQTVLLARYFGDREIESITTFDLKKYLTDTGSHLKQSSLGTRIRFIRAFFRWAADEGYCPGNPARKLREPKLPPRVPKAFSEEEAEELREACGTLREHALVEFMYASGCRVGEVYLLDRADIDWENRSCIVHGKGGKEREVYFTLKAKIWLQWYLNNRRRQRSRFICDGKETYTTHRNPNDTVYREKGWAAYRVEAQGISS